MMASDAECSEVMASEAKMQFEVTKISPRLRRGLGAASSPL